MAYGSMNVQSLRATPNGRHAAGTGGRHWPRGPLAYHSTDNLWSGKSTGRGNSPGATTRDGGRNSSPCGKLFSQTHRLHLLMLLSRRSLFEPNRVSGFSLGHITHYNLTAFNCAWPHRTVTNSSSLTQALDYCLFATKLLKLVWLWNVLGNLKVTETWS